MSGCIKSLKSRHSLLTALWWFYYVLGMNAMLQEDMNVLAWMFVTKQEVVTITVIIIESLGINDWLLAAFMLAKRKEGLSSHESFLFYTIFSWQVSSSSLNKRQECPPWVAPARWLCVNVKQSHVLSGCGAIAYMQSAPDASWRIYWDSLGWCKQNRGGSQQVSHSHNAYNGACSFTAELRFIGCFFLLSLWHCRKIHCKNRIQLSFKLLKICFKRLRLFFWPLRVYNDVMMFRYDPKEKLI